MDDPTAPDSGTYRPPAFRGPLVDRPDVVRHIAKAARRALTLVVAPAGWGKSVAVAQWAVPERERAAWIEFRDGDNASVVAGLLLGATGYLGARTERFAAEAPDVLHPGLRPFLVEQFRTLPTCFFVLDAVDQLDTDLQAEIGTLIEHAPPNVHFVATSRHSNVFETTTTALLRNDEVTFLFAADLAFDHEVAVALLAATSYDRVDAGTVDALVAATGGWPIAMRRAAATVRESRDPEAALRSFGGEDRQLRAFCRAQILELLDEPLRRFLLETSVADAFDAELAGALTGAPDAAASLAAARELELLEPANDTGQWWKYRPLLDEVLRAELRAADAAAPARLLLQAAAWHTERGTMADLNDAASYLGRSGSTEALLAHVKAHARLLNERGSIDTALAWLENIPIAARRATKTTSILEAAILTAAGETARAEQVLHALATAGPAGPGQRLAEETMRAAWVSGHIHPARAIEAADAALELVDDVPRERFDSLAGLVTPETTRTVAIGAKARGLWYLGRTREARDILVRESAAGEQLPLVRLHRCNALGELEAWSGSLTAAERYCVNARQIVREILTLDHPMLLPIETANAHVLIERADLGAARHALDHAARLAEHVHFDAWRLAYAIEVARLALDEGSARSALDTFEDAAAKSMCVAPLLEAQSAAITTELLLAVGHRARARRCIEAADPTFAVVAAAAVQTALADDDIGRARSVLARWPDSTEFQDELAREWWSAVTDFVETTGQRAVVAGLTLLGRAEAEGHARLFLRRGPHAHRLLVTMARRDPASYAASLLSLERDLTYDGRSADAGIGLSGKEREVLSCLAKRLTYAEIAEQLFVSQNTVKTHAKRVYMKLGASGRRDAIARAEDLGLL